MQNCDDCGTRYDPWNTEDKMHDESECILALILQRDAALLQRDDLERKGRQLCQQNGELLMVLSELDIGHHRMRGSDIRLDGHESCAICDRIERAFGFKRGTLKP